MANRSWLTNLLLDALALAGLVALAFAARPADADVRACITDPSSCVTITSSDIRVFAQNPVIRTAGASSPFPA